MFYKFERDTEAPTAFMPVPVQHHRCPLTSKEAQIYTHRTGPRVWHKSVNEMWGPSGINDIVQRRFKGHILMPAQHWLWGQWESEHTLFRGFWEFLVHKAAGWGAPHGAEVLLMLSQIHYCAEIGAEITHSAFSKIHKAIMHRAAELGTSHQSDPQTTQQRKRIDILSVPKATNTVTHIRIQKRHKNRKT